MKRAEILYSGSAPANVSIMYSRFPVAYGSQLRRNLATCSPEMPLLFSHQMRSSEPASRTVTLSLGVRPVYLPLYATTAEESERAQPSDCTQSRISCSTEGFLTSSL